MCELFVSIPKLNPSRSEDYQETHRNADTGMDGNNKVIRLKLTIQLTSLSYIIPLQPEAIVSVISILLQIWNKFTLKHTAG